MYPAIELIVVEFYRGHLQVPDITLNGDEQIDAVVLDEDAVGAPDGNGDGAKILRGERALDSFLGNPVRPSKVRTVAGYNGQRAFVIVGLKNQHHRMVCVGSFDLKCSP